MNPFVVRAKTGFNRAAGVRGWQETLDTITNAAINRYLYDLRWNPYLNQWVPEGMENMTAAEFARQQLTPEQKAAMEAKNQLYKWLPLAGLVAAGLVVYLVLKR